MSKLDISTDDLIPMMTPEEMEDVININKQEFWVLKQHMIDGLHMATTRKEFLDRMGAFVRILEIGDDIPDLNELK